jgi:hypothetical protein
MAATTTDFDLHDHSGIRWFAPVMSGLIVVLIGVAMMLIYPYVSG